MLPTPSSTFTCFPAPCPFPAKVRIGDLVFVLPEKAAVVPLGNLTSLPGARAALHGLTTIHGQVWPVVDLARLLGQPSVDPPRMLALLDGRDDRCAVAVEAVELLFAEGIALVLDPNVVCTLVEAALGLTDTDESEDG